MVRDIAELVKIAIEGGNIVLSQHEFPIDIIRGQEVEPDQTSQSGSDVGEEIELRAELLKLRRGPSAVRAHERLFLDRSIPDDVVADVLAFWRSDRDA